MSDQQTKLSPKAKAAIKGHGGKYHPMAGTKGRGVDFVTIVAHQMRTPLTAVKWYIDLLLSGKAGELKHEQRDYMLDIYQSNERMIRLVDNLLIIEQLEQDVLPIVQRMTSMSNLIKSLSNEYETFARVNKIALLYHCDNIKLPSVMVDPIYIRLALKNIFDNALRYTPKRGTVAINCEEKKESDGNVILITISDTGIGIPIDEQERIFSKFYRSAQSMSMQTEGIGLGLYIAKVIIERNGGKIWFTSRANESKNGDIKTNPTLSELAGNADSQGTTFYIQLPIGK